MKKKAKLIHLSEEAISKLSIAAFQSKSKFKPFVENMLENFKQKATQK